MSDEMSKKLRRTENGCKRGWRDPTGNERKSFCVKNTSFSIHYDVKIKSVAVVNEKQKGNEKGKRNRLDSEKKLKVQHYIDCTLPLQYNSRETIQYRTWNKTAPATTIRKPEKIFILRATTAQLKLIFSLLWTTVTWLWVSIWETWLHWELSECFVHWKL